MKHRKLYEKMTKYFGISEDITRQRAEIILREKLIKSNLARKTEEYKIAVAPGFSMSNDQIRVLLLEHGIISVSRVFKSKKPIRPHTINKLSSYGIYIKPKVRFNKEVMKNTLAEKDFVEIFGDQR
jgi:hypothetical protein